MKRDTFSPYIWQRRDLNPRSVTHKILSLAPLTELGNVVFLPLIKKDFIHDGIRTRNLQIRSLTRYPIAPHGQMVSYEFTESNFVILDDISGGAWTRDLGLIRPVL